MNLLDRFIPPVETAILWVAPSALALLMASLLAAGAKLEGVRTPYTRKIFHFVIFTLSAFFQWKGGTHATVVYGTTVSLGVLYACLRGEGYPLYEAMARPSDAPRRTLHVIVPLCATAAGGLFANLMNPQMALVSYLVGGWGDAVGEPVGTRWGKHRFSVTTIAGPKATRSVEGTSAVFVMSLFATLIGFRLTLGAWNPGDALLVAVVATTVESVSPHGLDNFLIQAAVAVTVALL